MEATRDCDPAVAANDDQMSKEEGESLPKAESPPPQDDFLTIVPKPTLLSKEKAKKRLQAFNLTKLNAYYNTKKKQAVEAMQEANEGVNAKDAVPAEKKLVKKQISPARETVEAIEMCKQEQVDMLTLVKSNDNAKMNQLKYGKWSASGERVRPGRRRKVIQRPRSRSDGKRVRELDGARNRRKRNLVREQFREEVRREKHNRDQSKFTRKTSPVRDRDLDTTKSKDKGSWNECEQDEKDIHLDVDVRKMLLFNLVCYDFKPFPYKKTDGTLATVSVQFLRHTVKSTPRVVYSPNPGNIKGTYFQRDEIFSIISKPQKECILNLINQISEDKVIAPSKALKTRNWYTDDYLVERHADEEICYETIDPANIIVEDTKLPSETKVKSKKDKSKRRSERSGSRKHRKDLKAKLAADAVSNKDLPAENTEKCPKSSGEVAASDAKRTDSHKSDTNSINSIENVLNNHLTSQEEDKLAQLEDAKTPPPLHRSSLAPTTPQTPKDTYTPQKARSSTSSSENTRKSVHARNQLSYQVNDLLDGKPPKAKLEESFIDHLNSNCKMGIKSYSKKPPLLPLSTIPALTTPTKIYKIRNDCLEKLDGPPLGYNMVQNLAVENDHQEKPDVRPDPLVMNVANNDDATDNIPTVTENTSFRRACFPGISEVPEKRPTKELPMEKLKSKPSELYSPTLQSIHSDSSVSEAEVPDTNEYKSHWESEEEVEPNKFEKRVDTSWESEEESCPIVMPRPMPKSTSLHERSLEMPLNIHIVRQRSQVSLPKVPKEATLFEDLDVATSWDLDADVRNTTFELNPDVNIFARSTKQNLEDEYMQFMSSVSTIQETTHSKQAYSSTSSSSSSSTSSSSITASSSGDEHIRNGELCTSSDVLPAIRTDIDTTLPLLQGSPVCNVDSTSSPAVPQDEKDLRLQLTANRKPLPTIVLAKKSPLVGCSLFRDEDSDEHAEFIDRADSNSKDVSKQSAKETLDGHREQSSNLRRAYSPKRSRHGSPSSVRHYNRSRRRSPKHDSSAKRDVSKNGSPRRISSPRRMGSPRKTSPRRHLGSRRGASPSRRAASPKRGLSPKRTLSPEPRDIWDNSSPRHKDLEKKFRREGSPRHRLSPRRRSPKHQDGSRSPKRDGQIRDRSPRAILELSRYRDYDRDKHEVTRYRDRKYREGSPRYRESPSRYSPSRRRGSPRNRYSPKRDRSPMRFRDRSPRRRSLSPPMRIFSRSISKERKYESITQALHRLAGMEYEPPKSPGTINSPMDGYIRGVPDSTISDDQLLQNHGVEFNPIQSPVYFNPPYKPNEGSPKRIPLDDRINQVLGIDTVKQPNDYSSDNYYNQMYYDQYTNNTPANCPPPYDQNYKHYNSHLVAVNSVSNKVLQVGNVLQVVPTEQQQQHVGMIKKKPELLIDPNQLHADMVQKFVPVGNMLEIVPSTELPLPSEAEPAVKESREAQEAKLAEDLLKIRTAERKAEREKRRVERDRRRKEKELKRKERDQRRLLKYKLKSEQLIKKPLMSDASEDGLDEEPKMPVVSMVVSGSKLLKSILIARQKDEQEAGQPSVSRHKKEVKFADGVLPGYGTSPSGGEELSSPPPFPKVLKEKRYTKTKKPKKIPMNKKKIKVKIMRNKSKKAEDIEDDVLPPPSPPPGSPPAHVFPPRIKSTLITPTFFTNYSFNPLNCTFPPEAPHAPFPGIPNLQYPPIAHLHLPPGQPPQMTTLPPMHPVPILLPPPPPPASSRLLTKPLSKPIDKTV